MYVLIETSELVDKTFGLSTDSIKAVPFLVSRPTPGNVPAVCWTLLWPSSPQSADE